MEDLQPDDALLLETALIASRAAGDIVSSEFSRSHRVHSKPDASVVSDVDVATEKCIRDVIGGRFPRHSFWGEETGLVDRQSQFKWIVDPLDGTKNFIRGLPLFSVEIALFKGGVPHIGVSHMPLMGGLVWAVRGRGAESNHGALVVSNTQTLNEAYVSFGNIRHFNRTHLLGGLVTLVDIASQARGIGDAWSLRLVANGSIDVFVDAHTAIWDIAALTVVIQEAGGCVTDLLGQPISPATTSVLATNSRLHSPMLSNFSSHR